MLIINKTQMAKVSKKTSKRRNSNDKIFDNEYNQNLLEYEPYTKIGVDKVYLSMNTINNFNFERIEIDELIYKVYKEDYEPTLKSNDNGKFNELKAMNFFNLCLKEFDFTIYDRYDFLLSFIYFTECNVQYLINDLPFSFINLLVKECNSPYRHKIIKEMIFLKENNLRTIQSNGDKVRHEKFLNYKYEFYRDHNELIDMPYEEYQKLIPLIKNYYSLKVNESFFTFDEFKTMGKTFFVNIERYHNNPYLKEIIEDKEYLNYNMFLKNSMTTFQNYYEEGMTDVPFDFFIENIKHIRRYKNMKILHTLSFQGIKDRIENSNIIIKIRKEKKDFKKRLIINEIKNLKETNEQGN